MKKYRKKPVVIEATQITDSTFDLGHPNPEHIAGILYDPVRRCAFIETLEGLMRADNGDWIIKGLTENTIRASRTFLTKHTKKRKNRRRGRELEK